MSYSPRRVRVLQASRSGNGCGIALVGLESGASFAVSVLPKWWRTDESVPEIDVDNLAHRATEHLHVFMSEGGFIRLSSLHEELLNSIAHALTGLEFDDQSDAIAEKCTTSLFTEVVSGLDLPSVSAVPMAKDQAKALDLAAAYWSGVEQLQALDLVRTPIRENSSNIGPLVHQLLSDIPQLERVLREQFVREVEMLLRRRVPEFRSTTETQQQVRGRIIVDSVIAARASQSLDIECESEVLDHDQPWQRLVRSAVRAVARRDRADLQVRDDPLSRRRVMRCQRIDFFFAETPLYPPTRALVDYHRAPRRTRNSHATSAIHLAESILRRETPIGPHRDRTRKTAIATGLRISSSRLFEVACAGVPLSRPTLTLSLSAPKLSLYRSGTPTKRPDLVLLESSASSSEAEALLLVDAKYKSRVAAHPSLMTMADQYQQFAYSAVSGIPSLFIFAAPVGSLPAVSAPIELHISGCIKAPWVANATVPFPGPEESWTECFASGIEWVTSKLLDSIHK